MRNISPLQMSSFLASFPAQEEAGGRTSDPGLTIQLLYSVERESPLKASMDTLEQIKHQFEAMMFIGEFQNYFSFFDVFELGFGAFGLENTALVLLWRGKGMSTKDGRVIPPSSSDRIIGGALLSTPANRRHPVELLYMCVADAYIRSGKGYGRILFEAAKGLARRLGYTSMQLKGFDEASGFYRAMRCTEDTRLHIAGFTCFKTAPQRLVVTPHRWMQRVLRNSKF